MKEDTRKRLSELILLELSEQIKVSESLGRKLEAFTDLPVEQVASAILKQFEYLLSSDLRDLIIHLIEQDVAAELAAAGAADEPEAPAEVSSTPQDDSHSDIDHEEIKQEPQKQTGEEQAVVEHEERSSESIMEYFEAKEPFPTEPMDIELLPEDWFCLYGFSYAPDSAGKGIPTVKLKLKGIDKSNHIFLLDYGDVRFYLNKLNKSDYTLDKLGKPMLASQQMESYKLEHEKLLNVLRKNEVLVSLPLWTIIQGREHIISTVEDRYVEFLRSLIDVHDAVDWDVEIFALDEHIAILPSIVDTPKERTTQREAKHPAGKKIDMKLLEKVIFREKRLAQEIHNQLLVLAARSKIDHMIRLDSALIDDWKSILSVRYVVNKDKRKAFFQAIAQMQSENAEFELMMRVSSPTVRFSFSA
jgi:hypothetical protein